MVTGASRGIGLAVATHLASQEADLILVARSSLAGVVNRLPGGPHESLEMDVRDTDAWERFRDRLAPAGLLHGLVTAAGVIGPVGPIGTWELKDFRETIDINVSGTLQSIMISLPFLQAAQGSIVTFSGGGATSPMSRFDAYATSKAAVVRLTENLSGDLAGVGVRVNSVAPGFVMTDMHKTTLEAGPDLAGAEYFDRTRQAHQTNQGDSPQLAADLVSFLLSEDSSGITGKLVSARWDPWRDPTFQKRLRQEPDFATLRRIDDQFFRAMSQSRP
jgi:NAD(P)-dependent dehydrogenase (short-subunit alcohol dehydrogenase family)